MIVIAAVSCLAATALPGCHLSLDTHGMTPEEERAYLARTQASRERSSSQHPDRLNSLEDADHWLDVVVLALFGEMSLGGHHPPPPPEAKTPDAKTPDAPALEAAEVVSSPGDGRGESDPVPDERPITAEDRERRLDQWVKEVSDLENPGEYLSAFLLINLTDRELEHPEPEPLKGVYGAPDGPDRVSNGDAEDSP